MFKLKKTDMFIILILLLVAVIIYLGFYLYGENSEGAAEILINGKSVKTESLQEDKTFSIESLPNVIFEIKDKKIRFLQSDCPDKVCMNTGFIGTPGQTAVCLPNAVSIKIIPLEDNKNDFDIVIG